MNRGFYVSVIDERTGMIRSRVCFAATIDAAEFYCLRMVRNQVEHTDLRIWSREPACLSQVETHFQLFADQGAMPHELASELVDEWMSLHA